MPKITINGVDVDVPAGTPVIAAADKAGVFIPRFCYHPDLRPAGNCRICQVEIEGSPRLAVSCMTEVKDGMVVRSDSPKVKKAVQADLEFLLLNHPVDCPICDQAGECYLQDFYMTVGMHESRIPLGDKVRKSKVVDLGSSIMLDAERCVMCSRCIRFSDEVTGTHQFGFFNRGSHMEIGTFRDRPLEDAYSGCYADVCPVGALTSNDFRFKSRVWFLKRTDSVCPHCSTGCNIRVDHKDGQAFRFVPRRNAEVNKSWMCDVGRDSYRELALPSRLRSPRLESEGQKRDVEWSEAVAAVVAAIRTALAKGGPESVVGIATPRATCEELWSFRMLMARSIGTPHLDFRVDPSHTAVDEREDSVLRRKDHHPNTRGAALLGLIPAQGGDDVARALERAAAGKVDLLYLLGPELLYSWPDRELVKRALAGAGFVVLHDWVERPDHVAVDALLPAASFAEVDGTYLNHAHRLQRLQRAFAAPGKARATVELLGELRAILDGGTTPRSASDTFRELAGEVPAFAGLTLERVGPLGISLAAGEGT